MILAYNTFLAPPLNRMSNLEQLSLYFLNHHGPIIDGVFVEKNIINRMTRLKKFTFNICSIAPFNNQVNLPSNEYIQNTFRTFQSDPIISCVDYFSKADEFHCHIYSYPYALTYYNDIMNNFPRGLFKYVREVYLFDERPFDYDFFLQIAQYFPLMEKLILHNREPQKNNNQQRSIIEYPHLTQLDLVRTHENYVEQFLVNTKMSLLNSVYLHGDNDSLERVTHTFIRDATRIRDRNRTEPNSNHLFKNIVELNRTQPNF
ncbi:unnamed protein product [Rotaria sp. Silwood2]|nr:unnamed protein product [Rotaria sp. Silwood2]CAF4042616.1 unnamed protein product [Rotaria sp. Silwood2]